MVAFSPHRLPPRHPLPHCVCFCLCLFAPALVSTFFGRSLFTSGLRKREGFMGSWPAGCYSTVRGFVNKASGLPSCIGSVMCCSHGFFLLYMLPPHIHLHTCVWNTSTVFKHPVGHHCCYHSFLWYLLLAKYTLGLNCGFNHDSSRLGSRRTGNFRKNPQNGTWT